MEGAGHAALMTTTGLELPPALLEARALAMRGSLCAPPPASVIVITNAPLPLLLLATAEGLGSADSDGAITGDAVAEAEVEGDAEADGDTDAEPVLDAETEALPDAEAEALDDGEPVGAGLADGVALGAHTSIVFGDHDAPACVTVHCLVTKAEAPSPGHEYVQRSPIRERGQAVAPSAGLEMQLRFT